MVVRAWTARDSSPSAAIALLGAGVLRKIATGKPVEDFKTISTKLGLVPHPGVLDALKQGAESGTITIRGWLCDAGALCALLALLPACASISGLRFWNCSLPVEAVELLKAHLPATVSTLAIEAVDEASLSQLLARPELKVAAMRCCTLPVTETEALGRELGANSALMSLSLFSCGLGDAGAAPILAALRLNASLLSLNLGANRLTDVSAAAIRAALETRDKGSEEEGAPNRSLRSLNLSGNYIGVAGRSALEAAAAASPALTRVELRGNPCLTAGPGAALSQAQREAIAASWDALGEKEGGKLGMATALASTVLCKVPAAAAVTNIPGAPLRPDTPSPLRARRARRTEVNARGGILSGPVSSPGTQPPSACTRIRPEPAGALRPRASGNLSMLRWAFPAPAAAPPVAPPVAPSAAKAAPSPAAASLASRRLIRSRARLGLESPFEESDAFAPLVEAVLRKLDELAAVWWRGAPYPQRRPSPANVSLHCLFETSTSRRCLLDVRSVIVGARSPRRCDETSPPE